MSDVGSHHMRGIDETAPKICDAAIMGIGWLVGKKKKRGGLIYAYNTKVPYMKMWTPYMKMWTPYENVDSLYKNIDSLYENIDSLRL